jgi:hypothetical protein
MGRTWDSYFENAVTEESLPDSDCVGHTGRNPSATTSTRAFAKMPSTKTKSTRKTNASEDVVDVEDESVELSQATKVDDQETEDDDEDDVEAERFSKAAKVKSDSKKALKDPSIADNIVDGINDAGVRDKSDSGAGIPMKFHVSRFVEYEPQKIVALVSHSI